MDRHVTSREIARGVAGAVDVSPAYRSLADALRGLISDGRIPAGARLPSERSLSETLGVSRTTVTRAYDLLREQRWLDSRQGSGTRAQIPGPSSPRRDPALTPGAEDAAIDLTCAAPTDAIGIVGAVERALVDLPRHGAGTGYYPTGLPALREAIAARYDERGLPTEPDQVLITSGALAAIAVAVRTIAGPGARALADDPTYPNTIATLQRAGVRLGGIGIGEEGWDLTAWEQALRRTGAKLAYLIPDFQNPTGHLMASASRERLASALAAAGTTAVVDETLVDLGLPDDDGVLLGAETPFAALAPDAVTVGSASKTFWGGLRIGWIRSPGRDAAAHLATQLTLNLGPSLLDQLTMLHLLGDRERLIAARRSRLVEGRQELRTQIAAHLPDWSYRLPQGGLSLWCELPLARSTRLADAASAQGIALAPGGSFSVEGRLEHHIRLPYTQPISSLQALGPALADAWRDATRDVSRQRRHPARPHLIA